MLKIFVTAACLSILASSPAWAESASSAPSAPSKSEAREFVERVEAEAQAFGQYAAKIAWVQATYITGDTNWLMTRVDAEGTEMAVRWANDAKRFNNLKLRKDLRRKLELLKLGVNVPAPTSEGSAAALANLTTRLGSTYAVGKIELDKTMVARNDLEEMMGTVRDPDRLLEIWQKWREVPVTADESGTTMKQDYASMVAIANAGAQELGFADLGAMWRSRYDMDPEEFALETDRLWLQVKPLYDELHCHVRAGLNAHYGDEVVPLDQPIRADLLGNMWAQSWGNIYDLVAPETSDPGFDLTELLVAAEYDAEKMMRTGEAFFSSLGFEPLPKTFWTRSQITKPADREVVCHASAWNLDGADDIRVKMCTKVNADDFRTVHHELGHNYYQRAYKHQPVSYQSGANGGFHEAIGDMIALSITPEYLAEIGLLDEVPDASADIGLLLAQALEKVAFLPFGLMMDRWRWQVFAGEIEPEEYNDAWWKLRERYQGVTPPVARETRHFDAGGKYHIPNNTSYTRYFVAHILQFQFHAAACEIAGWKGPLHRCSIYGSEKVGKRFNAMLAEGQSQPWPKTLKRFTGTQEMDGGAVVDYFAPLMGWLKEQNQDRSCGW